MDRDTTIVIFYPSKKIYIALKSKSCIQYIGPYFASLHILIIVKTYRQYSQVAPLGSGFHSQCIDPLPPEQNKTLGEGISSSSRDHLQCNELPALHHHYPCKHNHLHIFPSKHLHSFFYIFSLFTKINTFDIILTYTLNIQTLPIGSVMPPCQLSTEWIFSCSISHKMHPP